MRQNTGFTLLEMLVVIAILAAIAGTTATVIKDSGQDQVLKITKVEMQEIASAIRRFKKDTGYYPGQGPFAVRETTCNHANTTGGIEPISGSATYSAAALELSVNFSQLVIRPEICTGHALERLEQYNVNSATGWNGPYLKYGGYVGLDQAPDRDNGMGNLYAGENYRVISFSDPLGNFNTDINFNWFSDMSAIESSSNISSPYLFFVKNIDGSNIARIVSVGNDGVYDDGHITESISLEHWCASGLTDQNTDAYNTRSDDIILCL